MSRSLELTQTGGLDSLWPNGCRQVHATFGAFGEDLEPIDLGPAELLRELARGWEHPFERDPRLLAWLADFQCPPGGWPPYPIEGTPGSEPTLPAGTRELERPVA
jgi:hypothetical protein